jgi:ParB family transcriptional regulator, chromosome partitioning protein
MRVDLFSNSRVQDGAAEYLHLDPSHVRVWPGNARQREYLTILNCEDLIDSIKHEGQNHSPVMVRRIPGDRFYFELIVGTRRHFAASYIQETFNPEIKLLAKVVNMTDEEAFRAADAENRARSDVSAIERARNYADALQRFYGGKQSRMAEAMNVSKSWLSRMLTVATIPDDVLRAFASPTDLDTTRAYKLATALADEKLGPEIRRRARDLAAAQSERAGVMPIPASEVLKRLLERPRQPSGDNIRIWSSQRGAVALTLEKKDRRGLTLLVHRNSGATQDELVAAFRQALQDEIGSEI